MRDRDRDEGFSLITPQLPRIRHRAALRADLSPQERGEGAYTSPFSAIPTAHSANP